MSLVKTKEELKKVLEERKIKHKETEKKKSEKKSKRYTKEQALDELVSEGKVIGGTVYDLSELIVKKGKTKGYDWKIESIPHINTIMRKKVHKDKTWKVDTNGKKHYFYLVEEKK